MGQYMWDRSQQVRLATERRVVARHMSHFSFYNPAGDTYVAGWVPTMRGHSYGVTLELPPSYPYLEPALFVSSPPTLRMYNAWETINALGTSHDYHTYSNDRGCVQICHTRDWDASITCVQILLKAHLWLEAYELHLKTGRPIAAFLASGF